VRERWRWAVIGSDLPDAVKVTLLAMSLWMTGPGYVSVPREDLAELRGKDPKTISTHIQLVAAESAKIKLLDKVGGGYRGVTAMYAAVLPTGKVRGA
jgi:hypothetical protein